MGRRRGSFLDPDALGGKEQMNWQNQGGKKESAKEKKGKKNLKTKGVIIYKERECGSNKDIRSRAAIERQEKVCAGGSDPA